MNDLASDHQRSIEEVFTANPDFADRLNQSSFSAEYDLEQDTFYLTIGSSAPSSEAIYESIRNRVYLRLDPSNLKITRIEIPDVSRRIKDDKAITSLLQAYLPLLNHSSSPATQFADDLRELARSA